MYISVENTRINVSKTFHHTSSVFLHYLVKVASLRHRHEIVEFSHAYNTWTRLFAVRCMHVADSQYMSFTRFRLSVTSHNKPMHRRFMCRFNTRDAVLRLVYSTWTELNLTALQSSTCIASVHSARTAVRELSSVHLVHVMWTSL